MTSAMPVQCSNQLSYEVTQLRAGQFVGLMFSRIKEMLYAVRCLKSNEDMILALAGQFKQLSHEPKNSEFFLTFFTFTYYLNAYFHISDNLFLLIHEFL